MLYKCLIKPKDLKVGEKTSVKLVMTFKAAKANKGQVQGFAVRTTILQVSKPDNG